MNKKLPIDDKKYYFITNVNGFFMIDQRKSGNYDVLTADHYDDGNYFLLKKEAKLAMKMLLKVLKSLKD